MYNEYLTLDVVCRQFEDTLKIDYKSRRVETIITDTIKNLETAFNMKIDKKIYELQAEMQFLDESINILITSIGDCLKSMSFLACLSIYNSAYPETLEDKDFLGFAKKELMASLKRLQRVDTFRDAESIIPPLKRSADKIEICLMKRCLIIMFVLYELGVDEGVCVIAQYLYAGAV